MNTAPATSLWATDEVAGYLRTKPAVIHTKICRKELPAYLYTRMGRKLLFFKDKVIAWVEAGCPIED